MLFHELIWPTAGAGLPCPLPIMNFNEQVRPCHPERSEGSRRPTRDLGARRIRSFAALRMTRPMLLGKTHYRPSLAFRSPDEKVKQHHNQETISGNTRLSPNSSSCDARASTAIQPTQVLQLIQLIQTSLEIHRWKEKRYGSRRCYHSS